MGAPQLTEALLRVPPALARGQRPVFVFDLDSTLFTTGARHLAILREFVADTADRTGASWDRLRALVPDLAPADFGYDVTDPLHAARLRDDALDRALLAFWRGRYFTSRMCVVDEPAPGAVAYVRAAHEAGAHLWYLTGRAHDAMHAGTARSLRAHGFPLEPARTTLQLRPDDQRGDRTFKVQAARRIAGAGQVVAQFENEPANANALVPLFPDALHFLVGDVHSSAPERPRPELIPTADFVVP
jgi:hypothetical protein